MYREFVDFDRRACRGYRNGPDLTMFSSHEVGRLKQFFSNYEQYNDSDVYVSIRPGYYDLDISVQSNCTKGDSWCRHKLYEAMEFVKGLVTECCSATDQILTITIEWRT